MKDENMTQFHFWACSSKICLIYIKHCCEAFWWKKMTKMKWNLKHWDYLMWHQPVTGSQHSGIISKLSESGRHNRSNSRGEDLLVIRICPGNNYKRCKITQRIMSINLRCCIKEPVTQKFWSFRTHCAHFKAKTDALLLLKPLRGDTSRLY